MKVRVSFSRCRPYSQSLNQCLAHGGDSADAVFVRESNTVPNSQQTKQCTHARLTWVHTPYSVPGHHRPLPRSGTCPSKTCSHLVPLGSFPGFFYTLEGQNWNKIRQYRKKLELKVTMLRWSLKLKTIPSDAERVRTSWWVQNAPFGGQGMELICEQWTESRDLPVHHEADN